MNTIGISVFLLLLLNNVTFAEFETPVSGNRGTQNGTLTLNFVPPRDAYSHLEDVQMGTDINPSSTYDGRSVDQFIEALDCSDLFKHGRTSSGIYIIRPRGISTPFHVYCDMEKDGGGWTVIQRRGNFGTPNDFFDKFWAEYQRGFGDPTGEFWLGNDKISALTNQGKYRLKMELYLRNWTLIDLTYRTFKVGNEVELYKLTVGELMTPDQKDDMSYHSSSRFSTKDRDNALSSENCAAGYKGGWWYRDCYSINLNGIKSSDDAQNHIRCGYSSNNLRHAVMKIRLDNI